ncbi:NADH-dependent flavin oxidoreductase [Companilactobacillus alimentarius]|uniref:NADH-dependent flavin oxidoreductase n=1 Tax=Companilactobacillus alimentarius DSM 20249 TaxID=1423720 RepID=A0A2K9HLW6_9LACO|nr:NADH-dependent flavin oxidoreductase [Companilactobacillus alimentarius]AUI70893.1 NADH-dependent flavin oxidoreductase [Companilactobacillus alimentarius DSM 20249]KRK75002.1 Old Yellow Enzyme family NADH flavin oxidoreductase [Companilactobacillus alimentarius DSM 20249]MDT6951915.1 NADH-dependent flavin oxidoreductase [Companilactobacillus alimentarius]GEO44228.1 NADH-dependent flavin oxidoreductase [Companilactobacillus alimentarius]
MTDYNFLKPYTFEKKGITVKNRIVIPPMTEEMSFSNGEVTADELRYYHIHSGGAGIFITGVANVNALGKGFEGELSAEDDKFIPSLTKLASAIHKDGTKAILQIFSAGRMSSTAVLRGQQPVSASAVKATRKNSETPRALSEAEVEQTIKDFGAATKRAIQAGFDGVEIHGANTYLIQQFFSPHSNRRTDKWGGSLEKRMAFPLAVVDEVQKAIDKYADRPFLMGYRISPEEIEEPGIRFDDTLKLVDALKEKPLDYLHVSMGNVWRKSLNDKTITTPLNLTIKKHIGELPLIGVGDIQSPADAKKVLDEGIDFAALGREMLREPHWVQKVIAGDEDAIRYTIAPADHEELGLVGTFWEFLLQGFHDGLQLSSEPHTLEDRQKFNATLDHIFGGGK